MGLFGSLILAPFQPLFERVAELIHCRVCTVVPEQRRVQFLDVARREFALPAREVEHSIQGFVMVLNDPRHQHGITAGSIARNHRRVDAPLNESLGDAAAYIVDSLHDPGLDRPLMAQAFLELGQLAGLGKLLFSAGPNARQWDQLTVAEVLPVPVQIANRTPSVRRGHPLHRSLLRILHSPMRQ